MTPACARTATTRSPRRAPTRASRSSAASGKGTTVTSAGVAHSACRSQHQAAQPQLRQRGAPPATATRCAQARPSALSLTTARSRRAAGRASPSTGAPAGTSTRPRAAVSVQVSMPTATPARSQLYPSMPPRLPVCRRPWFPRLHRPRNQLHSQLRPRPPPSSAPPTHWMHGAR